MEIFRTKYPDEKPDGEETDREVSEDDAGPDAGADEVDPADTDRGSVIDAKV